ncbi:hypothetical protein M422DRAFT_68730 [Sphaerobolus stellatus SS14]|uniref:Uncharacterized protein n=1 Tax=Sphaerobolus stellatus (strain SS14) TaxID=990650 RepID=A0A0C9UYK7_SPHS4|nr:hypothetical protein M422DRAFT_68730 [Sphaerobolus stellatus SS14]
MKIFQVQREPKARMAQAMPVPNEILHDILTYRIIEDIHLICIPNNPYAPDWKGFLKVLQVSQRFRSVSTYILSICLRIGTDAKGNFPIQGLLRSLKHLWLISPIHLPTLTFLDIEHLSIDLEGSLSGILYVYRTASITIALWSQMSACGWTNTLDKWESFRTIKYLRNIILRAARLCDEIRPRQLTELASELIITHCVVPYLTCSYWHISHTMDHYLGMDDPFTDPHSLKTLTTILEVHDRPEMQMAKRIPEWIIKTHTATGRLLTREALQDSGMLATMLTIFYLDENNEHGFQGKAEVILSKWAPILDFDPLGHTTPPSNASSFRQPQYDNDIARTAIGIRTSGAVWLPVVTGIKALWRAMHLPSRTLGKRNEK